LKKIVVIGIGNSLRSDDGLGIHTAARLAEMPEMKDIEILEVQQLIPELADSIQEYDVVIFIDASYQDPPGDIKCLQLEADESIGTGFTHHFSPAHLLLLIREIYRKSPKAYLFSVGAQTFELGEELSPPVQKALPELINMVVGLIKQETTDLENSM